MEEFKAYVVSEVAEKQFKGELTTRSIDDLPAGEVLVRVEYSSVNYKDALSANGNRGVTRNYPHTPGIDAAGEVISSDDAGVKAGDKVIVTGYDLGMNTDGGFGQLIRVPASWIVPLPEGLSTRQAMIIGTAGLTAALCVKKLLDAGVKPEQGAVLVTGATGGVGVFAIKLLAKLGFEVTACTGKANSEAMLRELGATEILDRAELSEETAKPLLKEQWAAAVDVAGGSTLFNVIKGLRYGGSVAACGLVQSPAFQATVLPFILRGVNLLGVDSVELPLASKRDVWSLLAGAWSLDHLDSLCKEIALAELESALDTVLSGQAEGRFLVRVS
jgi:alcohol dehydrogenase